MELTQEQRSEYQQLVNRKFREKGLRQYQVAEAVGLSINFISEALRGARDNMQLIPTMKLLAFLDISYDQVAEILGIKKHTDRDYRIETLCNSLDDVSSDILTLIENIVINAKTPTPK